MPIILKKSRILDVFWSDKSDRSDKSDNSDSVSLFSAEVGGDFTPAFSLPFHDGVGVCVCAEPVLGSGDDLMQAFCLWSAFECGLALLFLHPKYGVVAVGIDGLAGHSTLLQ